MNTKAAIDTFMEALKSQRFDVQFCGITVGKADRWAVTEGEDGSVYILYYGFRGMIHQTTVDIAVDFEEGYVYTFTEKEDEYDIDYDLPHDIVDFIKGAL